MAEQTEAASLARCIEMVQALEQRVSDLEEDLSIAQEELRELEKNTVTLRLRRQSMESPRI
jgi:hypothetical protein